LQTHTVGQNFSVESESTSLCLKTQIANRAKNIEDKGNGTDPHKGLKDLLPVPDREKIMRYIYGSRTDWGGLSVSFTWGQNATHSALLRVLLESLFAFEHFVRCRGHLEVNEAQLRYLVYVDRGIMVSLCGSESRHLGDQPWCRQYQLID
jgi:hypothetical protein